MASSPHPGRHPDAPIPLAPLRHDPHPASLPTPLTSLVGRDREVSAVAALVTQPDVRLLTISGPGGVGKTRLALAVAERLAPAFGDGIRWVGLAPLTDPRLMMPSIAQGLGLREGDGEHVTARLAGFLRDKELLLVLDNVEHLAAAAPELVDLLGACPALVVLATSRGRLRVSGEREYPLPPLGLEAEGSRPAAAVRLFADRSQAILPDFALTPENATAVSGICRRLDGLPLAIELAATRVKVLSPPALLARLAPRLPMLTGGGRDLPARQWTMRATIAWSYDLLTEGEQALFRRLSVFAGGCTLTAAAAVAGTDTPESEAAVLEGITALVDQSLIERRADVAGDGPRFAMLETIREFAREQLIASGEEAAAQAAHATFYAALAEQAYGSMTAPDKGRWLDRLEADLDNFRAALAWTLSQERVELALRLAAHLAEPWLVRGHVDEGRNWLEQALNRGAGASTATRVRALRWAGTIGTEQGDATWARACLEEGLVLAREIADRHAEVQMLIGLARVDDARQRDGQVARRLEQALGLARTIGDKTSMAVILNNLASAAERAGDVRRADALMQEAVALFRELGDQDRLAMCLNNLGVLACQRGDYPQALAHLEDAQAIWQEMKAHSRLALVHFHLGEVARGRGDYKGAAAHFRQDLAIRRSLDAPQRPAIALLELMLVAHACGQVELAAKLLGAAEASEEWRAGDLRPDERAEYETAIASSRRALGDERFAAATAAGASLTLDEAIIAAEAVAREDAGAAPPAPAPFGLTPREAEVLRLLAKRYTDKEIAAALFISPRTVGRHVTAILSKLGVHSRREAATVALQHGLG